MPATGRPLPAVKTRKPAVSKPPDGSRLSSTTGNGMAADAAAPSNSASSTAMNDKPLSKPGLFGVVVIYFAVTTTVINYVFGLITGLPMTASHLFK